MSASPFSAWIDIGTAQDGETEASAVAAGVSEWRQRNAVEGRARSWPADLVGAVYRDTIWCDGTNCAGDCHKYGVRCLLRYDGGCNLVLVRVYGAEDPRGWELLPAEVPRG